jgi:pimeloyl-ACP methyl ester carboxylesterase
LVAASAAAHAAMLNLAGQNLYTEIIGKRGPILVFEAGLGNDLSTWRKVAPAVSTFARVVLYDHAGLGSSLPLRHPDVPIIAGDAAASLHGLLLTADLPPPYILVGHSLAGFTCRCSRASIRAM